MEISRLSSSLAFDAFENPIWNALHSTHRSLALTRGQACKYPADVAPFSALGSHSDESMADLRTLLRSGETTFVVDPEPQSIEGLTVQQGPLCLRMNFPPQAQIPPAAPGIQIDALSCADAEAMVGLTDVAYPGYFRARTCVMGSYFGVWSGGSLVAMAGERLCPFPFREISAVCTHPDHRGKGYAAALITEVLREQRRSQALSTLWVAVTNFKAIGVYRRLGFVGVGEVQLWRITRENDEIVPRGTI